MKRRTGKFFDKWHRVVEGQIRDCIFHHPRWFVFVDDSDRDAMINSLAKRIVGEIAVGGYSDCNAVISGYELDVTEK